MIRPVTSTRGATNGADDVASPVRARTCDSHTPCGRNSSPVPAYSSTAPRPGRHGRTAVLHNPGTLAGRRDRDDSRRGVQHGGRADSVAWAASEKRGSVARARSTRTRGQTEASPFSRERCARRLTTRAGGARYRKGRSTRIPRIYAGNRRNPHPEGVLFWQGGTRTFQDGTLSAGLRGPAGDVSNCC
jgi:hypothetical protein